jgi:hypothetical protein
MMMLNLMKTYSALIKKNNKGEVEDLVLLKEGFSWRAFIFNGLWFLYHKMWKEIIALILINFAFALFTKVFSDSDKILLEIAFIFVVALNANYWLCDHLKKKGYEFVGLAFGSDVLSAKLDLLQKLQLHFSTKILDPKIS